MIFIPVILGLVLGSFLNVCIFRIPRGESVVMPRSNCPKCRHFLPWYENIPVLSYIFLRGRCSRCRTRISFVYPAVEVLTAGLAAVIFVFFGLTPKAAIYFFMFSALIVVTFIDFERQEIPDIITLPGIAAGLITVFVYPDLLSQARPQAMLDSFLGVIIGGGSLYALGFLGEIVFKKEAMGGGDIKLLAMIGAFIGWKLCVVTFFLAPFFGSFTGLILKIRDGKEVIPYGPYLSLAALVSVLWGANIIKYFFPS
ncbi:MAG: prepilin peptidase [Candidatus Omnitrophota bacterium]